MRLSRSDCTAVRLAVIQPLSRHQKQRRHTPCCVFLEDDAIAASSADHARPAANGYSSHKSSKDNPLLIKGAMTDAQLRAAITEVIGPHGLRAAVGHGAHDVAEDDSEDVTNASDDIWSNVAEENILPAQELGTLFDSAIPESAGRADVRALEAMQTQLQKSKTTEDQDISTSATVGELSEVAAQETLPDVDTMLLPEIQSPSKCEMHRLSNDTSPFLQEITRSSKFLDRWTVFSKQLDKWGYADPRIPTLKRTMTNFARCNPDLLYMLPVRQLHIFVKKFRAFPSRSLDRKFRAAASRLANVYVDFQIQPTFNGNACFQDVTRLLLFVATSEFAEIEDTAPGIVAAASELLVEILVSSTQPPSELAREDHSAQWRDTRDTFSANATASSGSNRKARNRKAQNRNSQRKQRRSSQLHDEEADLAAERRLESMEEKLAASLRKGSSGQGSARPWTPWDNVSKDSGYGSSSAPKSAVRRQRARGREGATESRPVGDASRSRLSDGVVRKRDAGSDGTTRGLDESGHVKSSSERADFGTQRQRRKQGSDSRMDFMSLVGDGAVEGAASQEKTHSGKGPENGTRGGYGAGRGRSGYSGGVGLL